MNEQLDRTLRSIQQLHGVGAAPALEAEPERVRTFSTGVPALDVALGCGGWARGRIAEVFGPEAAGKTTLLLTATREMQALGGRVAFIDVEHSLNTVYARDLGVHLDSLLVSQPDNGEQALDIVEMLCRSHCVDLICLDSVAALTPRDEIEGTMSDTMVGLQARMMSKAMRKLCGVAAKSETTVLFSNQLRPVEGVTFGPSEVTEGGNALKYYASQRVEVRRIGSFKEGERVVGDCTRAKVVKNKLAPPFTQAEFRIRYGVGVEPAKETT